MKKGGLVRVGERITVTGSRAKRESLRGEVVAVTDCLFIVQAKNFKEAFRFDDTKINIKRG